MISFTWPRINLYDNLGAGPILTLYAQAPNTWLLLQTWIKSDMGYLHYNFKNMSKLEKKSIITIFWHRAKVCFTCTTPHPHCIYSISNLKEIEASKHDDKNISQNWDKKIITIFWQSQKLFYRTQTAIVLIHLTKLKIYICQSIYELW